MNTNTNYDCIISDLLRDKQDFNKIRPNIKLSIWEKDDDLQPRTQALSSSYRGKSLGTRLDNLSQIDEKLYYYLNSSGVLPETFYGFTEL